jgi:dipeptidyl aminopeptidase/acylaminoacyl peptidase
VLLLGVLTAMLLPRMAIAATADAPPPAEHYARRPQVQDVSISPSGERLALITFNASGRRQLAVMDLDPPSPLRVVAGFGDADITKVRWVNKDRLVYEAFMEGPVIERDGGAATFAVDHDGRDPRQLIVWNLSGQTLPPRMLPYGWFLDRPVGDGSDDVFVYRSVHNSTGGLTERLPARLNTRTAQLRNLSEGLPDFTHWWWLDAQRKPRLAQASVKGRSLLYWRAPGQDKWQQVGDFDEYAKPFEPVYIDGDDRIVVSAAAGVAGTRGLYHFDPVSHQRLPEPLVAVAGFDLNPSRTVDPDSGRTLGLHFVADRPMSVWFDDAMARLQRGVDAALPAGRSNRLYCGRCLTSRFIVVLSASDRQPGEYHLLDRRQGTMEPLTAARPGLDEARQGSRSLHRVTMRDGVQIPVYVTHPAGVPADRPLPTVVLVHGGPWVRGASLAWQADAQFLASRGYRVIEPEFRGSTGYGEALARAGWQQWGRAMQDDLVDALAWAAERQLVDPKRACIMGGSYGGYAALMGPIAHPDRWRCAISFAGVTDIQLMFNITWSDLPEDWKAYGMPRLIGDPVKDAAMLDRASPLKRAAEIKVPVLLVHGGEDRRVPIAHARRFADAARSGGVPLEVVEYLDDGHGFFKVGNHADFYQRVERFLDRNLKPLP